MRICDENDHGEIVYWEKNCPACARIAELEDQISKLQEQVQDLEANT